MHCPRLTSHTSCLIPTPIAGQASTPLTPPSLSVSLQALPRWVLLSPGFPFTSPLLLVVILPRPPALVPPGPGSSPVNTEGKRYLMDSPLGLHAVDSQSCLARCVVLPASWDCLPALSGRGGRAPCQLCRTASCSQGAHMAGKLWGCFS